MATSRAVIHYECQAARHLKLPSRLGQGGLTVHEGAWAYCDGDGADDAHDWIATGGAELESLVRWTGKNRTSAAFRGNGGK